MKRGPTQVALVVREGVLHECDQRRDQGGARRDQGLAHGLRESALIAAQVLDELLRRGRADGGGVSRMGGMVHGLLLDSVCRKQRGTWWSRARASLRIALGSHSRLQRTHHSILCASSPGSRVAQ
jgi:hypothetical protein